MLYNVLLAKRVLGGVIVAGIVNIFTCTIVCGRGGGLSLTYWWDELKIQKNPDPFSECRAFPIKLLISFLSGFDLREWRVDF